MLVLSEFLFRLSFGLSLAMAVVSPRDVSSGFFRNNLYIVLGLNALAAALGFTPLGQNLSPWPAVFAGGIAYVGAAAWLYEKPRFGRAALLAVAIVDFYAAANVNGSAARDAWSIAQLVSDDLAGGWLLGTVFAAMLLGHWYLNSPGMPLAPFKRLIACVGIAVALRAATSAAGLPAHWGAAQASFLTGVFVALHWLGGICGTGGLAWMASQTLKVPNTQSATGILYVAVMTTFLGELAVQLLSSAADFRL